MGNDGEQNRDHKSATEKTEELTGDMPMEQNAPLPGYDQEGDFAGGIQDAQKTEAS